ncbi:hypothetical protein [Deinococcus fonticola]|uniref:hypothetical protein n=1 Tax=Deinococcus fonticola TaxID=2528713 RepID=UPI001074BB78|nr:hypothetical protein [Deinococcus fonticola]
MTSHSTGLRPDSRRGSSKSQCKLTAAQRGKNGKHLQGVVTLTTRLHRRFLGPLWPEEPKVDGGVFDTVTLSGSARRTLTQQLTAPGIWRSGPLFGSVHDDVLHIQVAAPNGYRHWNNPVLDGNPEYQLGWADALQVLDLPQLEWMGNWILRPDNSPLSFSECEFWLREGQTSGLFDDSALLLSCGLLDGYLAVQPYVLSDNQVKILSVDK